MVSSTAEYIEETEDETITREIGQKKVPALQDLLGRHFIHDGTLYKTVFIYWDQKTNQIAALRRNCDRLDTEDKYAYIVEGTGGIKELIEQ